MVILFDCDSPVCKTEEHSKLNYNKTDFLENPNWLKKIISNTKHCLERLLNRLMIEITRRQISPKININWRRLWARQDNAWKDLYTGGWMKCQWDGFPRESEFTEEEYRQDKALAWKADKKANEEDENKKYTLCDKNIEVNSN